jgi:hypothetical protein
VVHLLGPGELHLPEFLPDANAKDARLDDPLLDRTKTPDRNPHADWAVIHSLFKICPTTLEVQAFFANLLFKSHFIAFP